MKCQILFSGDNNNTDNLSSPGLAKRVVKVNLVNVCIYGSCDRIAIILFEITPIIRTCHKLACPFVPLERGIKNSAADIFIFFSRKKRLWHCM